MINYHKLKDVECLPSDTDPIIEALFERVLDLESASELASMRIYDLEDQAHWREETRRLRENRLPSINTTRVVLWDILSMDKSMKTAEVVEACHKFNLSRDRVEMALDSMHKEDLLVRDGGYHDYRWSKKKPLDYAQDEEEEDKWDPPCHSCGWRQSEEVERSSNMLTGVIGIPNTWFCINCHNRYGDAGLIERFQTDSHREMCQLMEAEAALPDGYKIVKE